MRFNALRLILLLSFLGASLVQANIPCNSLPGNWHGIYMIKDEQVCNQFNGCYHLINAETNYLQSTQYEAHLGFAAGIQEQTILFSCRNGNVSLDMAPDAEVTSYCGWNNHCFIKLDSSRYYAELTNK